MSLSPWLQPSAINSPLQAASSLGIGDYGKADSLDKRDWIVDKNAPAKDTKIETAMSTRDKINEYKTVAETITNALGNRSPYYIIGEIPWESDNSWWGRHVEDLTKFLGSRA